RQHELEADLRREQPGDAAVFRRVGRRRHHRRGRDRKLVAGEGDERRARRGRLRLSTAGERRRPPVPELRVVLGTNADSKDRKERKDRRERLTRVELRHRVILIPSRGLDEFLILNSQFLERISKRVGRGFQPRQATLKGSPYV